MKITTKSLIPCHFDTLLTSWHAKSYIRLSLCTFIVRKTLEKYAKKLVISHIKLLTITDAFIVFFLQFLYDFLLKLRNNGTDDYCKFYAKPSDLILCTTVFSKPFPSLNEALLIISMTKKN